MWWLEQRITTMASAERVWTVCVTSLYVQYCMFRPVTGGETM